MLHFFSETAHLMVMKSYTGQSHDIVQLAKYFGILKMHNQGLIAVIVDIYALFKRP